MPKGNLKYAVLGLIALRPNGVHGYQLKGELESLCDDFWQVNYGRLYRSLDLLDDFGAVRATEEVQHGRPNKKLYRITEKGRQTLDDWLLQPPGEDPRPLRDELAVRLLFLNSSNVETVSEQIKRQRSVYITRLARIKRRRTRLHKARLGAEVTDLIMDGAEMRVQADLAWLDHLERKILRMSHLH